jgi:hypothetical protein
MENDLIESEAVAEVETPEPVEVESNEPESMLEAIQEGLKTDEPEEKAEETEEPKEEAKEEAKPADEDEPPEGISKKAQERFRNLTSRLKEKDQEVERLSQDLGGIRKMMQDTGGKPEDFAKTFEYIRALNHGDLDHAKSILEDQIRQLSIATGKPFQQVDPLSQFPDLRERVNSYQMDEQTAMEMARYRSSQQTQQRQAQEYQQRQQSEQQSQYVRQNAIAEIDRMGNEWAKNDPDYAMKEGLITAQAKLISEQFPPQQWPAQVKLMYQTISSMPMPKPVTNSPAPLRASGQSAGARQPTSMLEALQNGLGY